MTSGCIVTCVRCAGARRCSSTSSYTIYKVLRTNSREGLQTFPDIISAHRRRSRQPQEPGLIFYASPQPFFLLSSLPSRRHAQRLIAQRELTRQYYHRARGVDRSAYSLNCVLSHWRPISMATASPSFSVLSVQCSGGQRFQRAGASPSAFNGTGIRCTMVGHCLFALEIVNVLGTVRARAHASQIPRKLPLTCERHLLTGGRLSFDGC